MATIIPTAPPLSFTRGDTVRWRIKSADYPPPTWAVTLAFVKDNDKQSVSTVDNGDGTHLVDLDPATSKLFETGVYRFQGYATAGGERYQICQGTIAVTENFAEVTGGHDGRSHAAKVYDAVTALLEGKATHDQQSLSIGDRSLSKYPFSELLEVKGHYAWRMTEDEKVSRGYYPTAARRVRFTR